MSPCCLLCRHGICDYSSHLFLCGASDGPQGWSFVFSAKRNAKDNSKLRLYDLRHLQKRAGFQNQDTNPRHYRISISSRFFRGWWTLFTLHLYYTFLLLPNHATLPITRTSTSQVQIYCWALNQVCILCHEMEMCRLFTFTYLCPFFLSMLYYISIKFFWEGKVSLLFCCVLFYENMMCTRTEYFSLFWPFVCTRKCIFGLRWGLDWIYIFASQSH